MKYATEKTFDGQRASLGKTVVVRFEGCPIEAGIIEAIKDDDAVSVAGAVSGYARFKVRFAATKTEDNINALPEGSWTWPVRV